MDDLPDPVKDIAEEVGGSPGSHRWELITAIFGWGAVFCLLGLLVANMLGFDKITTYATAGFSTLLGIAFKRDIKKLLTRSRPAK
ncbi:hypothetical protein FHW79_005378 [Azospirillum sp. OGB3]|uniref:hypothetical protein n=1 Tax=Azospirillum sp. OGB3 TaxID=2587012 RepID=UPI001605D95E|nr:hypothetical protein [Azospirillum sp. OGB3]MBB3267713.1 hypothetical protein [Azospirillum sp. OGB3]